MPRKALVEILGDPKSFINSLRKSASGVESFKFDLKELAVTAKQTAETGVQASLKRDARLRQEVIAYRNLAKEAKKGSREQVTAANHAATAELRLAKSMGVAEKEARKLGHTADKTHGKIMQSARGAIAGSGAFRAMGRSIAFASGTFLTMAGAAQLIRVSISAASDLTEQVNKSAVVFRGSKKAVLEWAHTLLPTFGMTRAEAIQMLGTFGNMLVPMGFARTKAREMSEQLVELAGDMASFNNASPVDVLQSLQAGLSNQPRPLRRFGVFLTQARIAAEALSSGIVKANVDMGKAGDAQSKIAVAQARLIKLRRDYGANSTQAAVAEQQLFSAERQLQTVMGGNVPKLTNAQKALAIYQIILKDTADAHGDAARTGKEWAGQMRALHALAGDLEEELGKLLMPTFLRYIRTLVTFLSKTENQKRVIHGAKQAIDKFVGAMSVAATVVRRLGGEADGLAGHLGGWKTALELAAGAWLGFKAAGVGAAVAVQAANLVAAGVVSSAWKAALISTGWGALAIAAGAAAAYVVTHWAKVKVFFAELWIQMRLDAAAAFTKLVEPFSHLPGVLGAWAREAKDHMTAVMETLKDDMGNLGTDSGNAFGKNFYMTTKQWADATQAERDRYNLRAQQEQLSFTTAQLKQFRAWQKQREATGHPKGGKTDSWIAGQIAQLTDYAKALRKQIVKDREKIRMSVPDTDPADLPDTKPGKPPKPPKPPKPLSDAARAKDFALPYRLQLEEARAQASGSAKAILAAARHIKAFLVKLIPTLKGQKLLDAYGLLGQANDAIASAAKDAAAKAKKDAASAKKKLDDARKKMQSAIDTIRGQIGDLFQGPVLAPTEEQRKQALGVPGLQPNLLLKDLKAQTAMYARFNRDLIALQKKGASKELVRELRAQGITGLAQIEALLGADKKTQQAFFREFSKREKLIQRIARAEIHTPKVNLHAGKVFLGDPTIGNAVRNSEPIVIPITIKLDESVIAKSTTKHQVKARKSTTTQVRGRNAGRHTGGP